MTEYWFLILCGIVYLFNFIRGLKKGFVGMLYRFLTTAVAVIAAAFAADPLGICLKANTGLYTFIEGKCSSVVTETTQTGTIADSLLQSTGLLDQVAGQIADVIYGIVVFILAFLLIKLALWLFLVILESLADLPLLRTINRIGGAGMGILNATLFVWILMLLISSLSATEFAQSALQNIQMLPALQFLYANNPIQHIVNAIL